MLIKCSMLNLPMTDRVAVKDTTPAAFSNKHVNVCALAPVAEFIDNIPPGNITVLFRKELPLIVLQVAFAGLLMEKQVKF